MSSFLEELGLLDRPFVSFTVKLHGKDVSLRARALSGREADELEALQLDEYGRILASLMEAKSGSISELERVRRVYAENTPKAVAEQLVMARENEVVQRAIEIAGIDFRQEAEYMKTLSEEEADAYAKTANEKYEAARKNAKELLQAELEQLPIEELARQVAQVTINVRAQRQAQRTFNDLFLSYCLYEPENEEHVFADRLAVGACWSADTIAMVVNAAREALKTDVPFDSPDDSEPAKPPSSPSTSEEATADGGTPTMTTSDA